MFIHTENPQGLTYIWNNIEGLMGEEISYIVCRTMTRLPLNRPEIGEIISVGGKSEGQGLTKNTCPKWVHGNVFVEISYQPPEFEKEDIEGIELEDLEKDFYRVGAPVNTVNDAFHQEETIFSSLSTNSFQKIDDDGENVIVRFAIPYRGLMYSHRIGDVITQVKFIHAQQVGLRSLLVEAVVALTSSDPLRLDEPYKGKFSNKTLFRINKSLPSISEPLTSQVRFTLLDQQLDGSFLRISGLKETCLMYVAEKTMGEKVILTRQLEHFAENIKLDEEIQWAGPIDITNENLSVSLVNSREVIIEGKFGLKMVLDPFNDDVLKNDEIKEMLNELDNKVENDIVENEDLEVLKDNENEETKADEVILKATEEEAEEKEERENEKIEVEIPEVIEPDKSNERELFEVSNSPSQILRESKRAKLTKHMRELNKNINNKNQTKAFLHIK